MRLPFQRKNQPAAARDSPKPLRSDAFLLEAMDAWGDVVYRVALAQTGSPSDADDVFQDVFMRLLENDTAFESDEHLKAWLLRVTVNRCRDLARLTWNRRTEGFTRAGACRHPRPRRVRRRHLGGRGRVAARPAHPGAPVLRRGLRHRRDRAHHGMSPQHRANPPPPRPPAAAQHARRRPRPTRVEPCKLPRPPMPKGAEP